MAKTYDCAVIGAGSFGAWTALRLRESGRSVVLIDGLGPGNPKSSSGGASRLIRMGYGFDEIYTRWSRRSLEAWKELFARVNRPDLFQETGVLWTARPGHPHGEGSRSMLQKLGIPYEVLDSAEVRRRYRDLHFADDIIGIFEPGSGALLAAQAVRAVVEEAVRAGVEFVSERCGARPVGIDAGDYIYACGPWLPKLFPDVVGARIQVTRQPIFYFEAPHTDIPSWIDFSDPRGGYAFPPLAGKPFKLALDQHGSEFDPDSGSRDPAAAEVAAVRAFLAERFPSLAEARQVEAEVCQYESTCTGDFLIDRHPERDHVWLVGGGSGHGFKHGPAVGEYVVKLLDGAAGEARFSWQTKSVSFGRTVY